MELFQIPGDPKNRSPPALNDAGIMWKKIVCDPVIRQYTVAQKQKDAELRQCRRCQNYICLPSNAWFAVSVGFYNIIFNIHNYCI